MQYISTKTTVAAALGAAILFGVFAVMVQPVFAKQPPKLNGTYGVTGSGSCVQSPNGFNPNLTPIAPAIWFTQTVEGEFTFNPDGTGTRSGTSMVVNQNAVNVNTFTGDFTYTVDADGTIHFTTSEPTTGTHTQGTLAGATFSASEVDLMGHVSKDGSTIVLSTTEAGIETVTRSNGDEFERICNRSRVLTEL